MRAFCIDYGGSVGNFLIMGDLEEAKALVDRNLILTRQDAVIYEIREDGEYEMCRRRWQDAPLNRENSGAVGPTWMTLSDVQYFGTYGAWDVQRAGTRRETARDLSAREEDDSHAEA